MLQYLTTLVRIFRFFFFLVNPIQTLFTLTHTRDGTFIYFIDISQTKITEKWNIAENRALWRAYSTPIDHIDARECHA